MKRGKLSGRETGWLLFAAALVALGMVCFAVSGTLFLGYLCVEGAACCAVWIFLCRKAKQSRRWLWCKRLFAAGFAAMVLLLAVMEGFILTYGARDHMEEPADAVIILGAGINDSEPSPALWTRLRKAEAYMERHPEIPVVLSGGLGLGEKITEAECMYNALRRGEDDWDSRLLQEPRATSTAENFRYSIEVLREAGVDPETATVAVVTNDFHMFRTHLIARRAGMEIIGLPADLPWWWVDLACTVRESFALVKTLIFD